MAVRDLSAFYDEALEYPDVPWRRRLDPDDPESAFITGVSTYRVASPDAKTGLYLTTVAKIGVQAAVGRPVSDADMAKLHLNDEDERELYQVVLGETYQQMIADGVSWNLLQKIGQDAYLSFAINEDTANAVLAMAAAQLGEAPARPNRATRRAATRTRPRKDGSKSSPVSTGTQAQTRGRTSTRSSSTSEEAPVTG
ncbi:hypothetical protein [Jatrophihabitans sp.]|uniref:DUF7426 family protein n=1 Tax=Jatrophihabitans sp. TaxID=1932789 RepID=UPI0030C75764|nr:hypothetical protein [Jatrophihabitans sp.]